MKEFQLCGLGNAVVDIFLEISDEEFASLGFERGGMQLVEHAHQKTLLERYQKHEPKLVSGGSVANSVIAFSQLGGRRHLSAASATTATACSMPVNLKNWASISAIPSL
jgi:hypothetical protein